MRVALIGSRVGYINRGFESFTRSLFELLKDRLDITLLKGGGAAGPREVVVPSLWLQDGVLSQLGLPWQRRMQLNEKTFALGMLPHLLRHHYDVIHFSEYGIGTMLLKWRRLLGWNYKLVFSNGAPAPPDLYGCFDMIQEVTAVRLEEAAAYGIPRDRLRAVPYGIHCDRFARRSDADRNALRDAYGIPRQAFVVLCVAALKRHHKRVDFLIDAVAKLPGDDHFLVVAGQPTEETAALRNLADERLGDRYCFLTLPHESIHEVYQLADVFVLPSLVEGFGIVIGEAMAASLPVLVHDAPSFRWVVGDDDCLVDMNDAAALVGKLGRLADAPELRRTLGDRLACSVRERFGWASLADMYVNLYRDAVAQPMPLAAAPGGNR